MTSKPNEELRPPDGMGARDYLREKRATEGTEQ